MVEEEETDKKNKKAVPDARKRRREEGLEQELEDQEQDLLVTIAGPHEVQCASMCCLYVTKV